MNCNWFCKQCQFDSLDFRYCRSNSCTTSEGEECIFLQWVERDSFGSTRECTDEDTYNLVSCDTLDRSTTDRNDTFDIPVRGEPDICCFWVDFDLTSTNKRIGSSFCSDASNIEEQIFFQRIEGSCFCSTRQSCNVAIANKVSCSCGSSNTTNLGQSLWLLCKGEECATCRSSELEEGTKEDLSECCFLFCKTSNIEMSGELWKSLGNRLGSESVGEDGTSSEICIGLSFDCCATSSDANCWLFCKCT